MRNGRLTTEDRHLRTLFGVGAVGHLSDGQLLGRFLAVDGEPAELAFAALVERHGAMVLRVARSVLRDEHLAHDAFQATFLVLARRAGSLWVRDSLGPWLHAVAGRVAANGRASEARRRKSERDAAGREAFEPCQPDRDDLGRAIHEEIDRLPERYRSAVVLCHLESLTQHEAASRLGWPVGTLQSRLARGRQKLRERLGRRGLTPGLLGVLPPIRPSDALVASTARAASTLTSGGSIAGMIGPAVLAMIDATSKGMLMTKLKLGTVALLMICMLFASATRFGGARPATASDGKVPEVPREGRAIPPPVASITEDDDPLLLPRPAEDPSEVQATGAPELRPKAPASTAEDFEIRVLLDFHATWSLPCNRMRMDIDQVYRKGGVPIKTIDIDQSPGWRRRYRVTSVPTLIVVDGAGRELNRFSGEMRGDRIVAFFEESAAYPRAVPPATSARRPEEAAPLPIPGPRRSKPWESIARIRIADTDSRIAINSGVAIASTDDESIILTGARNLESKDFAAPGGGPSRLPRDYRGKILADLFDGQTSAKGFAVPAGSSQPDLPGELMGYDWDRDLALIRIHPGRRIPVARVVPSDWVARKGMKVYAAGCSLGESPTVWETAIRGPVGGMSNVGMACDREPDLGRIGGGLFTSDGFVAGICSKAESTAHLGLYTGPQSIRSFLDDHGLAGVYQRWTQGGTPSILPHLEIRSTATPAAPSGPDFPKAVIDQERRLNEVEGKLDRILDALKVDSLKDVKGDFDPPRKR